MSSTTGSTTQRPEARRVPVIGVNLGRVGFLTSVEPDGLEDDLGRAFAGDYEVVGLPALQAQAGGERSVAVNDVVVASSIIGRMVELGWEVGGEDLGVQPCDGLICSTPSGSTAYNLSNGGPGRGPGVDALAGPLIPPHPPPPPPAGVPRP